MAEDWQKLEPREPFGGKGEAASKFGPPTSSYGLDSGGEWHSEFTRGQSITNSSKTSLKESLQSPADKLGPIPTSPLWFIEDPPIISELLTLQSHKK